MRFDIADLEFDSVRLPCLRISVPLMTLAIEWQLRIGPMVADLKCGSGI